MGDAKFNTSQYGGRSGGTTKEHRELEAELERKRQAEIARIESERVNSEEYKAQMPEATAQIENYFEDKYEVLNSLGFEPTEENYEELGDSSIDWENLLDGYNDPDKGDADGYKKMAKSIKTAYGESSWYGGWKANDKFNKIKETELDSLIKKGLEAKVVEQQRVKADNNKTRFEEERKLRNLDESAVVAIYENYDYEASNIDEKSIIDDVRELKKLQKETKPQDRTLEQNKRMLELYDEIETKNKDLGNSTLYDYEGNSIEKITKKPSEGGFEFDEEQMKEYEKYVKNSDYVAPTYSDHVDSVYHVKLKELALNDYDGEQISKPFIVNDPEAWDILKEYKTGTNKHGNIYEGVPVSVLSKYYNRVIATDGDDSGGASIVSGEESAASKAGFKETGAENFLTNNKFDSPLGHVGLLENYEKQKFGFLENKFFDEDEFADKDLSRNWKLGIRNHRDDRKQILQEKEVLKRMSLMNVDKTMGTGNFANNTGFWDTVKQGGDMIAQGFKGDLAQWTGADKLFEKLDEGDYMKVKDHDLWTERKYKDVAESLDMTYGNLVSDEAKENRMKRSIGYRAWEGFTGFVPALAEFALIDVAAKKTGIITGIPRLANRTAAAFRKSGVITGYGQNIRNTTNFLGHAFYEELKMYTAFDEHYHMGGGVAFYGIGKALPFLKSSSPALNAIINNPVKGGIAGMASVQTAQNLEAVIADVRGNKTFMTHINETYYNEDGEFKFTETTDQMLVDFLVFGALGIRGMQKQAGNLQRGYNGLGKPLASLGIAPVQSRMFRGKVWWKGIESVHRESSMIVNRIQERIDYLTPFNTKGKEKGIHTKEIERLNKELLKWYDLKNNSFGQLKTAYMYEDWQDDKKATEIINRQFQGIKSVIDPTGKLEFVASKKAPDWVTAEGKDAAAEINAERNKIWINTTIAEPGKMPHEIVHYGLKAMMKRNPDVANQLRAELSKVFDKKKIFDVKSGNELFIQDMVDSYRFTPGRVKELTDKGLDAREIREKEKELMNEEYVTYVFEALANPLNYSRFVSSNKFKDLGTWSEGFMKKTGIDYRVNTKEDLVNFFYALSKGMTTGKLNKKQWELFQNVDKQNWLKEPIGADMRTAESKSEAFAFEASNSKDLGVLQEKSNEMQKRYNDLTKDLGGKEAAIKEMLKPDPKNPTTSVSKDFDAIVYNVIKRYNDSRVAKGLEDQQVLDPVDKYMLATELVYDLSRGKNRGLEAIIKTYDPAKYGKTEAEMPLSKHVMQQLAKRVYEIKEGSMDAGKSEGDLYQTISFSQEGVLQAAEAAAAKNTTYTDFTHKLDKQEQKKIRVDGKEYNYPIVINEAMGVPKFSPIITKDVITKLPFEKLTFMGIGEKLIPDVKDMMSKSIGVDSKMKPSEYIEVAREWVGKNEELAHEMIPRTSNPEMYENSMIGKTIFKKLFKETNEVFKSSELPDWLSSETNARAKKWEKIDYNQGELSKIIFGGRDNVANKKNFEEFLTQVSKVNSSQIARDAINNKAIQDLIQAKDRGKYHKLKLESKVIPLVIENIRGASGKSMQSKDFGEVMKELGVWNKFVDKTKDLNFSAYETVEDAFYALKFSMTNKEQLVLEKNWDKLTGVEGYKFSGNIMKSYSDRAQALREMGAIMNTPIVPKSWSNRFKGINADIKAELAKQGWNEKDILRLNIDQKNTDRRNSKDFVEKYHESLQDIAKTLDPASYKVFINSIGNGKYKFLNSDKLMTATERDVIFKDIVNEFKEPKEGELGFGLKPLHVKLSDNGLFKAFVIETAPKFKTNTPAGRRAYAKELENYLTPNVTKAQAKKGIKKATLAETELANQLLQETIYSKLFDYYKSSKDPVNALNNIQFLLQLQASIGGGFTRGTATHTSVTLERSKEMHSEHEFQAMNFNGNFLLNMIKNSGSKEQFAKEFKKLSRIYKQSIITEDIRETQDADGNTTMKEGYNTGMSGKFLYLESDLMAEKTLDIKTGKTEKELTEQAIGINRSLKEIEIIRSTLLKQLNSIVPGASNSKTLTSTEMAIKIAKTKEALRLARLTNKPRKGISVFDFDDTLAKSNSQVLYTMPNGKKGKLNATEFALKSEILEAKGAKFDFTEFNKVIEGKKGPLFDLAQKRAGKFGTGDIFVLTARPAASANAIHKFLKGVGLEIPIKNITGLENGSPQAKAMWILDKASKGYNDFYFADDAPKNVKAVEDILNVIDAKRDVQLALQSKDVSAEINNMIERKFGIGKDKTYSASKAKVVGDKSGKTQIMASSAQDFQGLIYRLLGKGKQGDLDMKFFKDKLMIPFAKGNNALSADKISMVNDFRAMKKEIVKAGIPKDLTKEIPGEPFTIEQAVRVFTWTKQGMEVPNLSKADAKLLNDYVESKPALKRFSQQLIELNRGEAYQAPKQSWLAGTITTDLFEQLNKGGRAKHLTEFQENADMIFSPENLNKMQAALGTNWRSAMENMLQRMKTGRNRPVRGGKMGEMENMALDWINSSVGAIMFLNTRSAVLQTISTINYINWHDNNPLMAGKAILNQKQYWKDYVELITSDFMVERRGGNQINVNESEIADAAKQNGVQGAISYLLNKGFVMTRAADSHAIASGGATFFRNRINTYKKQGMSEAEAKSKAFDEFREITEESQQSSRVDRISAQQASNLGRVVLAFANTPSQYARIMQRSASDLKNGRGDWRENISKIIYYGAVQNLIFNALQNALFKDAFDGNDEIDTDTSRIANGMIDSLLRGAGWQGAALSTIKGMILDVRKQSQKNRPKYADSALKLLDISPPVDSKISKLRGAGKIMDYEMKEIREKGPFDLTNPAYLAGGQVVSAITNVPLDRAFKKYNNISDAMKDDQETWKSIALSLGWSEWELESKSDSDIIDMIKGKFGTGKFKKGKFKKGKFGEK